MLSSFKTNPVLWLLSAVSLACLLLIWRCDHLSGTLKGERLAHNATRSDLVVARTGLAACATRQAGLGQRAADCEDQRGAEVLQRLEREEFFKTATTINRSCAAGGMTERVLDHESRKGFADRFNADF